VAYISFEELEEESEREQRRLAGNP
jgi:hypothetical protein